MELLRNALHGLADGIGPFIILLGLLIFVHELGHFLVAKFFGVRVEIFSLGFGKILFSFQRGDTNYRISLIPLGGYVKMFGDDPSKEIPPEEKKFSFLHKPVGQRIWIVLAGPLMNLLFAFFLYILIVSVGESQPANVAGDVAPNTRAYEAGFRSGDKVLEINGESVKTWLQVRAKIEASADQRLNFVVERNQSPERAQISITPTLGDNENILSSDRQVGTIEGLDPASLAPMIGVMGPDTWAAKAGLKSLDMIVSINDRAIYAWRDLEIMLQEEAIRGRTPFRLKVQSYQEENQKERDVTLSFGKDTVDISGSHGTEGYIVPKVPSLQDLGIESAQTYLWRIKRGSPADKAGLKQGDRLLAINGTDVNEWSQVMGIVKTYDPDGKPLEFKVRRDAQELSLTIVPELSSLMNIRGQEERRYTVGIVSGYAQSYADPVLFRAGNALEALAMGAQRTVEGCGMVIMGLVRLVQGDVSAKNIGGIITIGRFANQSFEAGLSAFLRMMALISINLFLLNLLPVPVLDGGHLVFFSIEALRGTPLSMRKMEIAQQVGLVLLMSLMAFALFNDISNWLNSMW